MSPLRDPAEAAINRVVLEAEQSAHLYEDAAQRASDPGVTALFETLASERRALANGLAGAVRSMGELPEAPDPDAESLHRLVNAARALFTDENRALLEDRERAEATLADAIDAAIAEDVPEGVRSRLAQAKDGIAAVRERLREEAEEAAPG